MARRLRASNPRHRAENEKRVFPVVTTLKVSPALMRKALEVADGDASRIKLLAGGKVEVLPK